MAAKNELVVAEVAPGRYQKMTREDADKAGYAVHGESKPAGAKTTEPADKSKPAAPVKSATKRTARKRGSS